MAAIRLTYKTGCYRSWRIYNTEEQADKAPCVEQADGSVTLPAETIKQMAKAIRSLERAPHKYGWLAWDVTQAA